MAATSEATCWHADSRNGYYSVLCSAPASQVFARSVIPASSLVGQLRRLRKFNDSSLGEMLFRDASMRRHRFQIAAIAGNDSGPHAF